MPGRIRTIKPELREDFRFASLTDRAARIFTMVYTLVDDIGVCPSTPAFLGGAVFFARPCTPNLIGIALAELEVSEFIWRFNYRGSPHLQILGWSTKGSLTYQCINKPIDFRFVPVSSIPPGPETGLKPGGSRSAPGPDLEHDLDLRQEREREIGTGVPPAGSAGLTAPPAGETAEQKADRIERELRQASVIDVEFCLAKWSADRLPELESNGASAETIAKKKIAYLLGATKKLPKKPKTKKPTATAEETEDDEDMTPDFLIPPGAEFPAEGYWFVVDGTDQLHLFKGGTWCTSMSHRERGGAAVTQIERFGAGFHLAECAEWNASYWCGKCSRCSRDHVTWTSMRAA